MRSLILVTVLLAILPLIAAQTCTVSVRTPYVTTTYRKISRDTTCHWKCVLRHKKQINTDYDVVNTCSINYKTTTQSVCCEGYQENAKKVCEPVCHGCQNGTCVAPNSCTCNAGFRKQLGVCVPVCDPECGHGTCVAPGECSCREGYAADPKKGCVPACEPACLNGECVGLNTCECFSGFRETVESHVCMPECDPDIADCGSGTCVGPNRCDCVEGFIFEGNRCIPRCDTTCINGDCTKPNTCTCKEGFVNSPVNPSECVPFCSSECQNGTCVGPDTCQCLPGYQQSHTVANSCEPSCDSKFVDIANGECIAPNVLQCSEGFQLEYSPLSGRTFCRYPCDAECVHGLCLSDGSCQCWDGFSPSDGADNVCEPIGMNCTQSL
ncbi:epidermal growth factor-like protein [Culex pipiens pallens]|uniref:epidermal growth factor-like protein n=1 Tax=Culex pipiens pallens TaxID=42434 RepID=UPI001953DCB0|nr:epidermal growth factor-like protein [Culex pipiens pallens]